MGRDHLSQLRADRFRRALPDYDTHAIAQQLVAKRLIELCRTVLPINSKISELLEFGCGSGLLTDELLSSYQIEHLTLNDLYPEAVLSVMDRQRPSSPTQWKALIGDAEHLRYPADTYGLIASASTLQWFERPDAFLQIIAQAMKPAGVLAFSTFAPGNLYEFSSLTGQGLAYTPGDQFAETLDKTYSSVEILQEEIILEFETPADVLTHFRSTGVTGTVMAASSPYWTPNRYRSFHHDYKELYSTQKGTVHLTYRPLYILAQL